MKAISQNVLCVRGYRMRLYTVIYDCGHFF